MKLPLYLKRSGITTGPIKKNSSYSHLDRLRRSILCIPQFVGGEYFLYFGVALHELFLEDKRGDMYYMLKEEDQRKVEVMVSKLNAHPVVRRLLRDSVREQKKYGYVNEVELAFILDIDQEGEDTGSDLKSTTATTYADCAKKYVEFGYVKQGFLYKKLAKRKNFFLIFISKIPPHPIFILNTADFKKEERYAEKELEFLLYFYKHYGNFITEEDKKLQEQIMARTGKDAMNEINDAFKAYKEERTEANKVAARAKKSREWIVKMIVNFPKKDHLLYVDKLEKITKQL